MAKCGFINGYQKDMCLKGTGLCVQHIITKIGSIVNVIWRGGGVEVPTWQVNEHKNIHLHGGKMFIWAPRSMRKATMAYFGLANPLIARCLSLESWKFACWLYNIQWELPLGLSLLDPN